MTDIYTTTYTKEQGKQVFTKQQWYKYDTVKALFHRVGGPAIIYSDGSHFWFTDGRLHRLDGPAYNWGDGYKEWYIDNIEYTEEKHKELIQKYKQLPRSIKMSHKLWWVREL